MQNFSLKSVEGYFSVCGLCGKQLKWLEEYIPLPHGATINVCINVCVLVGGLNLGVYILMEQIYFQTALNICLL